MLITVLIAVIAAKIKGYKLKPLLKAYFLYPIFIFELFEIFLQANIFLGNYSFTPFANIIKSVYMFLFILPMIGYKLYKQGIIGSVCIITGTALNKIAIAANGGKMPVFPTLSKITGYYNPQMFERYSSIHILGDETAKLKILTDYIDTGYSILSIGDLVIRVFVFIIIFYSIKTLQRGN